MEHFELTQDPEGIEAGTVKIWHFELTQDHLDTDVTEGMQRSLRLFLFATPTIWVSMDSPGHQQSRFGIFS